MKAHDRDSMTVMKPPRTFRMSAALPIAAMLVLSGCGGGGGSASGGPKSPGGDPVSPPAAPTAPTLADALSANPREVRGAAELAALRQRYPQSSQAGNIAGVTGDAARASFDGRHVSVTVRRANGSSLAFNSASHSRSSTEYGRILTGYSLPRRHRGDELLTYTDTSVTVASVYTNWNDTDPTDYLAAGYWMHLKGRVDPLMITGAEIGAFVDGPEIRGAPPELPLSGSAAYIGRAEGFYGFEYGGAQAGASVIGKSITDVRLDVSFYSNTISGCIGCNGGISVRGVSSGGSTQAFTVPVRLRLQATTIKADSTFEDNVRLERDDATVTSSSGSWGGRFSNKSHSGNPRLAAGTAGAKWAESDGSRGVAVGAWVGILD